MPCLPCTCVSIPRTCPCQIPDIRWTWCPARPPTPMESQLTREDGFFCTWSWTNENTWDQSDRTEKTYVMRKIENVTWKTLMKKGTKKKQTNPVIHRHPEIGRRAASISLVPSRWSPPPRERNRWPDTAQEISWITSFSSNLLRSYPIRQRCDERIAVQPLASMEIAALLVDGAAMAWMMISCRCRSRRFLKLWAKYWNEDDGRCYKYYTYLPTLHTMVEYGK